MNIKQKLKHWWTLVNITNDYNSLRRERVKKRKDREQQLLLIWIELSLNGILIILFWYLYHRSAKWKHHNWTAQYWQEHGPILVEEPWQFNLEASTRLVIISLNARFISGPAWEVIEWGCSWPGVFLLGASGRTGRFFTQLLFRHPHSLSSFLSSSY